ncbi:MAG: glycosyltransferase family 4 protein [bacterium]|nr:glycosyltransferase family 4 protein [bacterium]
MKKICHLSSVHPARDPRIFYKECRSLAEAGYDVTLIALHDEEEVIHNVKIVPFPKIRNRFARIAFSPLRMFFLARKQEAKIYHFHDPELIFTGLLLRLTGKKVIFDVHENIVKQIRTKKFLGKLSSLAARLFVFFNYLSAKFFHLVLAEHSYEEVYKKYTAKYRIVLNMPDISFFEPFFVGDRGNLNDVFYIGRVTRNRGVETALKALHILKEKNIRLNMHFVGHIDNPLKKELENLDYFEDIKKNIIFYGRKNLEEGYEVSKKCLIGISVLKPIGNFLHSYSTKVFEYMAVSMPVITSDFELYKGVVERHRCGFCIDPESPQALAHALEYLLTHKAKAKEMGQNGRTAALTHFNWQIEEKKLLELYKTI